MQWVCTHLYAVLFLAVFLLQATLTSLLFVLLKEEILSSPPKDTTIHLNIAFIAEQLEMERSINDITCFLLFFESRPGRIVWKPFFRALSSTVNYFCWYWLRRRNKYTMANLAPILGLNGIGTCDILHSCHIVTYKHNVASFTPWWCPLTHFILITCWCSRHLTLSFPLSWPSTSPWTSMKCLQRLNCFFHLTLLTRLSIKSK